MGIESHFNLTNNSASNIFLNRLLPIGYHLNSILCATGVNGLT